MKEEIEEYERNTVRRRREREEKEIKAETATCDRKAKAPPVGSDHVFGMEPRGAADVIKRGSGNPITETGTDGRQFSQ